MKCSGAEGMAAAASCGRHGDRLAGGQLVIGQEGRSAMVRSGDMAELYGIAFGIVPMREPGRVRDIDNSGGRSMVHYRALPHTGRGGNPSAPSLSRWWWLFAAKRTKGLGRSDEFTYP